MGYSQELKDAINRVTYLKGVRERALDAGDEGLQQWADSELQGPYDFIRGASMGDYELLRDNPYSELLKNNARVQAEPTEIDYMAPLRLEGYEGYQTNRRGEEPVLEMPNPYPDGIPQLEMPNPYLPDGGLPTLGSSRGHGTFSEEWLQKHSNHEVENTNPYRKYDNIEEGELQTGLLPDWLDRLARFLEPASQAQEETGGGLGLVIPPGSFDFNKAGPDNPEPVVEMPRPDGGIPTLAEQRLKDEPYGTVECSTEGDRVPERIEGLAPPRNTSERYDYIFGKGKKRYDSVGEARGNMVNLELPVWKLDEKTGEKYPSNVWIDINKKLAPTVRAIFKEIYNDPERFPIKSIGGWRWPDSYINHPSGTAIDINPDENAMMTKEGQILAGRFYDPSGSAYSIPADGSVVRAFKKYGWDWGGNWGSKYDYMHFSYLGG